MASFVITQRRSGSFEYRTTLPARIDAGKVDAKFDNGVLTVSVTRPERSKAPHQDQLARAKRADGFRTLRQRA